MIKRDEGFTTYNCHQKDKSYNISKAMNAKNQSSNSLFTCMKVDYSRTTKKQRCNLSQD